MARNFNGTTSLLQTAAIAALRPSLPVTVAAWVKPDVLALSGVFNNNKVTSTHCGVWLQVADASGHLDCGFGDNTGSSSTDRQSFTTTTAVVTVGVWQHVACAIRGAADMTIWIGGFSVAGTTSGTGGALAYNTGVGSTIGAISGAQFFDGAIAEVCFWGISLSDGEVASLAAGTSPLDVQAADLLAYWPICGVQSPEPDYARGNAATVTGATLADTYPYNSDACDGTAVGAHVTQHIGRGLA